LTIISKSNFLGSNISKYSNAAPSYKDMHKMVIRSAGGLIEGVLYLEVLKTFKRLLKK
jgi:hypothetical protein